MGPAKAVDGLRKALAMGGDDAVHVQDDALHGSDALATSLVLATALERIGFDLVLCGMASTDAEMSVVPAMVAERLGVPQLTFAASLEVADGSVSTVRASDGETHGGRRRPARPGLGHRPDAGGALPRLQGDHGRQEEARHHLVAGRPRAVRHPGRSRLPPPSGSAAPKPPRQAGTVVVDDGDGAVPLADFLVSRQLL